jgi:hypothetical protein
VSPENLAALPEDPVTGRGDGHAGEPGPAYVAVSFSSHLRLVLL